MIQGKQVFDNVKVSSPNASYSQQLAPFAKVTRTTKLTRIGGGARLLCTGSCHW